MNVRAILISVGAAAGLAGVAAAQMPGYWVVPRGGAAAARAWGVSNGGTRAGTTLFFSASVPQRAAVDGVDGSRALVPQIAGLEDTILAGLSADGGFAAVTHYGAVGALESRVGLFGLDGTHVLLPEIPGEEYEQALAISSDGSTIVGYGKRGTQLAERHQPFMWSQAGGMRALGHPRPGGTWTDGRGVSADGAFVVGSTVTGPLLGNVSEAFVWSAAAGYTILPEFLPPSQQPGTAALAVSGDGRVIVGTTTANAQPDFPSLALRWVDGVPTDLGSLPGYTDFNAYQVDDGGGVILGKAKLFGAPDRLFVWTEPDGMRFADDYFASFGVALPGVVSNITDMSPDGRSFSVTFAGLSGSYIVTVPGPASALVVGVAVGFRVLRRRHRTS